jgi:hypothetical protein
MTKTAPPIDETPPPPTFDCRAGRHKVITADRICCLCGARGVIDARRLMPPAEPVVDITEPRRSPLAESTR